MTLHVDCQFVFHLAGVNRPENPEDFMIGNFGFTTELLDALKKHNNKAPIVISSSIQAAFGPILTDKVKKQAKT